MKQSDRDLGLGQPISRRDFINGAAVAITGALAPGLSLASAPAAGQGAQDAADYYPPTRTGLRGHHPGSFETAHALRQGRRWDSPAELDEYYDLVVVGAGISGLSAAWRFREMAGPDARILVLDNHDDFGGHAKRNEFHYEGHTRYAWGGAINLEFPHYSRQVSDFLARVGIDIPRLSGSFDFDFSTGTRELDALLYFDKASFGRETCVRGFRAWDGDPVREWLSVVDRLPLPAQDRDSLRRYLSSSRDLLEGMDEAQRLQYLRKTSFLDFITGRGGVTPGAARVFRQIPHGIWGAGIDAVDVANALGLRLPLRHALGRLPAALSAEYDDRYAMFPDGNASVARMMVRGLIPGAADGQNMDDILGARFDYSRLDQPGQSVRLRLNATAVDARNLRLPGGKPGVAVTYVRDGRAARVRAGRCVLACNNKMIPYLVQDLPRQQVQALAYAEKVPLLVSNVLLGDERPVTSARFGSAHSPGRLHSEAWTVTGFGMAPGQDTPLPSGPTVIQFYGGLGDPAAGPVARDQYRMARKRLLGLSFEDLEREVREHLSGLLADGDFDPARDIKALTVNRWAHGYAYEYISLSDPDWAPGQAPHEIGRRTHGRIAIANADAAAYAYLDGAVEQGLRAVQELAAL